MKKAKLKVESRGSKVEGQDNGKSQIANRKSEPPKGGTPNVNPAERLAKLAPAELEMVKVGMIEASPTNPRKTFSEESLKELAESIAQHGVQSPIKIRPIVKENERTRYELVFGERRWRAAKLAKLEVIPCLVQKMDEQTAMEVQQIENLQREDLDPLEEAQGYAELMRKHGYSVDDLVAVVGKKGKGRSSVFNALGLLKASKPIQEALRAGKIDVYVANEIRKVPGERLQSEVLKEVLDGTTKWIANEHVRSPLSVRDTKVLIAGKYQLNLNEAPFDVKAIYAGPILHPDPCGGCPHRSGNAKETFPDIKSPDVCTNPTCFEQKKAKALEMRKAAAKASGQTVLSYEQYRSDRVHYVDLQEQCYETQSGRRWKDLIKGQEFKPVLVEQDDGGLKEMLPESMAKGLAAKNGVKFHSSSGGMSAAESKKQAAMAKKKKLYRAAAAVATGTILEKLVLRNGDLDSSLWKFLARGAVDFVSIEQEDFVAKRRGLSESINESRGALRKWLKANEDKPGECAQLVVELLLCAQWNGGGWQTTKWSGDFEEAAKLAGVKLDGVLKEAERPKKNPALMTKKEFAAAVNKLCPEVKDKKDGRDKKVKKKS